MKTGRLRKVQVLFRQRDRPFAVSPAGPGSRFRVFSADFSLVNLEHTPVEMVVFLQHFEKNGEFERIKKFFKTTKTCIPVSLEGGVKPSEEIVNKSRKKVGMAQNLHLD